MSQQSYSKILLYAAAMMAGIVLSVCSAMAQNFVTGRVVDLTSEEPMAGAMVTVVGEGELYHNR